MDTMPRKGENAMGKKLAVDDWTINDILELYVANGLFVDKNIREN